MREVRPLSLIKEISEVVTRSFFDPIGASYCLTKLLEKH